MQKWFIIIGCLFIILGILLPFLLKLGIGRLPGDIIIKKGNVTFYFPIVTCLILSLLISFIIWLMNRW